MFRPSIPEHREASRMPAMGITGQLTALAGQPGKQHAVVVESPGLGQHPPAGTRGGGWSPGSHPGPPADWRARAGPDTAGASCSASLPSGTRRLVTSAETVEQTEMAKACGGELTGSPAVRGFRRLTAWRAASWWAPSPVRGPHWDHPGSPRFFPMPTRMTQQMMGSGQVHGHRERGVPRLRSDSVFELPPEPGAGERALNREKVAGPGGLSGSRVDPSPPRPMGKRCRLAHPLGRSFSPRSD